MRAAHGLTPRTRATYVTAHCWLEHMDSIRSTAQFEREDQSPDFRHAKNMGCCTDVSPAYCICRIVAYTILCLNDSILTSLAHMLFRGLFL
jgi:hypothetical protein